MCRIVCVLVVTVVCMWSNTGWCDEPEGETFALPQEGPKEPPVWTVQVDPLTTALGYVHLQFERAFSPHLAVYAGPHLRLFDGIATEGSEAYSGYGLEVGVRWFLRPTAPQGWWLGVRGVGAVAVGPSETVPGGYVSALGGYTAIFGDWFVLSGGAGVQYIHYTVEGLGPKGVFPALHTAVGVAF